MPQRREPSKSKKSPLEGNREILRKLKENDPRFDEMRVCCEHDDDGEEENALNPSSSSDAYYPESAEDW